MKINVKKYSPEIPDLKKAYDGDACFDVSARLENDITINPGQRLVIPTGYFFEIPPFYELQVRPRSGLASKNGITIINSPGTLDQQYRGELCVLLINHSDEHFTITNGMRIAQIKIEAVIPVDWNYVEQLSETQRGEKGFGSSGI